VFTGVAAVAVQLTANARTARGLALAVLGLAFAARAVGDVRESFLSWFSPIGWSQQVRVSDDHRLWPLALSAVLILGLLAAAAWLVTRRDLGSGILPARPGPTTAAPALRSPFGLAWRLQRGSILGWAAGLALTGVLFGSLTEEIEGMMEDNPTLAEYFASTGGSITDSFFATALLLMSVGASGFAVASGLRLRSEESNGRLEPVLAGAVSRSDIVLQWLAVTLIGMVLVVTSGGVGLAVSDALVRGEGADIPRLVGLSWAYLPAMLVLPALAALLTGLLPRAAMLAWAWLAVTFVVSWLGPALDLPGAVNALSPFDHLPAMPGESIEIVPMLGLTLLAAALTAAGVLGFRRRDALVG
jgi:ABC-2 type transport system permease protein